MSITIQIDLPDALVDEARSKGLLESAFMGELLATELRRRRAAADLDHVLNGIRSLPGQPMSEEEVVGVVKTVRRERRAREARR